MSDGNGELPSGCLLGLRKWSDSIADAKDKIDALHDGMKNMMTALAPLKDLAASAKNIETNLIGPATNVDRIPVKTAEVVLMEQAKSYRFSIMILSGVVISLTTIIGVLLIGHHFKWVDFLG